MLAELVIEPTLLPVPTRAEVARRVGRATRSAATHLIAARRRGKLDELAVAGRIATDLAVLRPLCTFVARQVAVGIAGTLAGLVQGLETQVAEELDLTNEARSLRWFGAALELIGAERLVVPEVYADASGR